MTRGILVRAPAMGRLLAALTVLTVTLVLTSQAQAAFPGANGRIAFAANPPPESDFEVFTLKADGTDVLGLTNNSAGDTGPAWSPDGSKLAFRSDRDGPSPFPPEIYTMNADGTSQTRLTNNLALDLAPNWSPDGTKIAFYTDRDNTLEIYTMNANGTSPARLTNNAVTDRDPAWSPDGTKIAFRTNRDGNDEIYTMNANGTSPARLTNNAAVDAVPDWSPDGTRIAFRTTRDGNNEIYTMNADGTNQTRLTNNTASDDNPAWSPDGTKIAFDTDREGNFEIYTMNADGTNPANLLINFPSGNWTDIAPDWQPVARNYARPKAASPIQVALVPAYKACTQPNTNHKGTLTDPSCNPPEAESGYLTMGTADFNGAPANATGSVRLSVFCNGGAAGETPPCLTTPGDQLDGRVTVNQTDVRCQGTSGGCSSGTLSDYSGNLRLELDVRVTDRNSGGATGAATVTDLLLSVLVPCATTTATTVGSTCSTTTSFDAVLGGSNVITEQKRAIWGMQDNVKIYDGGADGMAQTSGNTLFLVDGLFFP